MQRKIRGETVDGEKILVKDTFGKGLLCNQYKELLKLNNKKTNPIKKLG